MNKTTLQLLAAAGLLAGANQALAEVHYVDVNSINPTPPYANWTTAATRIQDAVDAAVAGDEVVVTNGIYATGGRAVYGTMTNRVAVDKPLTLRSVNGPQVTIIRGYQVPGTTNGDRAIRCVYLTNGAHLAGFTLTNGAARAVYDYPAFNQSSGGGLWCEGTNTVVVSNCVVTGNSSKYYCGGAYGGTLNYCTLSGNSAGSGGGGAYSCTLNHCTLSGNSASSGGGAYGGTLSNCTLTGNSASDGGGASGCTLYKCVLTGNSATSQGGGAEVCTLNSCALTGNSASSQYASGGGAGQCTLNNCTLSGNSAGSGGGGAWDCVLNNCIVYFNTATQGANYDTYGFSTLNYCCTMPQPTNGVGNIILNPKLASAWHLSSISPCRGAGNSAYASGTDIDGEAWANPSSIGCDEYHTGAVTGPLNVGITASFTNIMAGFTVQFSALIDGRTTASSWDFGDGVTASNQPYAAHAWTALGDYAVVLRAYNESQPGGIRATVTVHVVTQPIHYVAADSANPVAPYISWATAATNVQDAVDAATVSGALVLVTNGTYATGSRVLNGTTNRVVIAKPLEVRSVNGPQFTVIDGGQVAMCVYLTNSASLSGFSLTRGAGYDNLTGYGYGAYGGTLNNCAVTGNSGEGADFSTLNNCTVTGNARDGADNCTLNNCNVTGNSGGARESTLNNCAVTGNSGSGAYYSTLNNCTLTGNSLAYGGIGAYACTLNNCIVCFNGGPLGVNYDSSSVLNYCCTTPLPTSGLGNISPDPQLASVTHLSAGSPCRGAGSAAYATGTDIDGEAWGSPPSIGCDEYHSGALTGPLTVAIAASFTNVTPGFTVQLTGLIEGRTTASIWDFGDGIMATNQPYTSHAWNAPGDYVVVLSAYNESQPGGVSGTFIVHVVTQPVHYVAASSTSPVAPYTNWTTAATKIQDAVDAATVPGALVLVTNGIYAAGGRDGNRVAVYKTLTVRSVNGPQFTAIDGGRSVRCAYLASGASMSGLTLRNGAAGSGAGVYCESTVAVVSNCVVAGNSAVPYAGGAYGGTLNNCTLSGNSASGYYALGGGAYGATLNNCTLSGNSVHGSPGYPDYAGYGGGAHSCTLNNCALNANSASIVGGAYNSTLNNCALTGNTGDGANGCTLTNCTLVGNAGVGASGCTLYNCALTNNSGGGASSSALTNCTLTGNSGGGANYSTLNNCTLSGNSSTGYGGGASGSTLDNCTLSGNSALYGGGGSYSCTLTNCILSGNSSSNGGGGGAYYSTLKNCKLTGNSAPQGGGASSSTVDNCALSGNSATFGGGASSCNLTNCTLTGNSAANGSGGGASGSALNNCIVYLNFAGSGSNYDSSCTLNYCCTIPLPTFGVSNIVSDPQLASRSHLSAGSPCRGAGNAAYVSGTDIDGEAWLNPPSIGCDDYHAGAVTGPLNVGITASFTSVLVGFTVQFSGLIEGRTTGSLWDFGDGLTVTNQPYTAHAWTALGDYAVVLRAYNESSPGGISATVTVHVVTQPIHYVAVGSASPVAPYTSWATAARNIQEAVDAAIVPGALVLVTNGIYAGGGRAVQGTLTNRVAVDKVLTLRSVNGPQLTMILGRHDLTNNGYGDGAIRCVYLTTGASLDGFTLTNGATRAAYYDYPQYRETSVGGVWCEGTNTVAVSNCVVTGNSGYYYGGAAHQGTLNNCVLTGNSDNGAMFSTLSNCTLSGNSGSGASGCTLNNCTLTGNSGAGASGCTLNNCALTGNYNGGAWGSTLNNCTLTANSSYNGGGANGCTLNNCIVYFNTAPNGANYDPSSTLNYCCTTPQPANGLGNISLDPQLASAWRLSSASPCRGSGSAAYASGTDIDGEAWASPPSIGCDEYHAGALTGSMSVGLTASFTNVAPGFTVQFTGFIEGRAASSSWDFGDGATVTNQPYTSHAWAAPGKYAVILRAYNESSPGGIGATFIIHVVSEVHYVAADSSKPVAPYVSWATAATNIQDAVDSAIVPGALVLVTNGVYATGGGYGSRVVGYNLVALRSVNGPQFTAIDGGRSVQCVYLISGARMSGFTLTNGAGYYAGVYCDSALAVVSNCVVAGNSGVGASGGTLINCTLTGNTYGGASGCILNNCTLSANSTPYQGGGANYCTLNNCTLTGNSASLGGGAYGCALNNCTLTANSGSGADSSRLSNCALSGNSGSGANLSTLNNCTVTGNAGGGGAGNTLNNCILFFNGGSNYDPTSRLNYCCTTPLPAIGAGNISFEPELASASHLSAGSPCRGAGSAACSSGTDIDGESWFNPPSIGCDEYHGGAATGPLTVGIAATFTNVGAGYAVEFTALIQGRTTDSVWDFDDGFIELNQPYTSHAWDAPGDYRVALWAFNDSHPGGVRATVNVHVGNYVYYVAAGSTNPVAPYASWATAATNIQDAVDAAVEPGALVLVTNGIYSTGSRQTADYFNNRVVVAKPLSVRSVNGPQFTAIDGGQWNRCVYLTNFATLSGFTLTNGYGGAFGGTLSNCTLTGNFWYGANSNTLNNCILTGNPGGGASGCTLNNCALTANAGAWASASILNNCTVTGNTGGAGVRNTLNNCIVYFNTAGQGGNYDSSSILNYCCTTPLPTNGVGNISSDPQLASTTHLSDVSPCRGAGNAAYASGADIDGEDWASPPSIGCDEYHAGAVTGPLSVGIAAPFSSIPLGFAMQLTALIAGRTTASMWDLGDGITATNQPYAVHAWGALGDYTVVLRAYNETQPGGLSATVTVHVVVQPIHYVAADSASPAPPYQSWATAARNIQEAVDAALAGSLVVVTNGSYAPISVNKLLTVRSVNGPQSSTINGGGWTRCVYLATNASLSGFTLSNGFARDDGSGVSHGGGAYGGTLTNCTLVGNVAEAPSIYRYVCLYYDTLYHFCRGWATGYSVGDAYGGGAAYCTLNNCTLTGNVVKSPLLYAPYNGYPQFFSSYSFGSAHGGGAAYCTLNNCTLTGNLAEEELRDSYYDLIDDRGVYGREVGGGGTYGCTLANCTLSNNRVQGYFGYFYDPYGYDDSYIDVPGYGGGALAGTLTNCTLAGNSASDAGGGAFGSTLNNSTLTGNFGEAASSSTLNNCALSGNLGVGASSCSLNNCTLTGNSGGANYSSLNNCIAYFNQGANYSSSTLNYCCTTPQPTNGLGNISLDPLLASASHLSAASPCRGAGNAADARGTDIDGEAWARPPSIGCDEYHAGAVTGPLSVGITASFTNVTIGFTVQFTALIDGRTTACSWDFGDGSTATNQPYVAHAWTALGDYAVVLRAYNESQPGGISATVTVHVVTAVHYVALDSATPVAPYTSWATAATNIQDAVDAAAVPGAQVVVTNGTYVPIHASLPYGLTMRSVNGAHYTLIDGAHSSLCVSLANGANLSGFTLANGNGGASGGTLNSCILAGNSGNGASGCTLNNCELTGNSGGGAYGGTLNNCTVTANSGGGASGSVMNNCVVYFNSGVNYDSSSALNYCCTTPQPANGAGNISADPQLASASHLSAASPCRGAGSATYASGTDIDSEAWGNPPSIGCDEYHAGALTGPLSVGITASFTNVAVGFRVDFTALIQGRTTDSVWDFDDGFIEINQPFTSHAWDAPGDYRVALWAFNESQPGGVSASVIIHVLAGIHYVAAANTNQLAPYTSWATAATNIQDAVDAAIEPGAQVLVTNGIYDMGGRAVYGTSNRVAIPALLTLRSVNGPLFTTIDGGHSVRCVYLTNSATLSGFTLANGVVPGYYNSGYGAGVFCESLAAVVSNCVAVGNAAGQYGFGGGAYGGTLNNCTLSGNSASDGGGAYYCTLNNCVLAGNSAPGQYGSGGGAYGGTLNNCTLSGNSASNGGGATSSTLNNCTLSGNSASDGGGAYYCTLNNCVLAGNSAPGQYGSGGGAYGGTLNNCTLSGNSANDGGGATSSTLNNCTVTGNLTSGQYGNGGGVYNSTLNNCIVYFNSASSGANYGYYCALNYCCTTPLPTSGIGNITSEPLFDDNLRLQFDSPCINAGNNSYATSVTDLDGNPRIAGGTVDIGAYEFQGSGLSGFTAWLWQHGLPTDGSADFADPDNDGMSNWQEWIAGTNPTDAASALRLLPPVLTPPGLLLRWTSDTNHVYFVERARSLAHPINFSLLRTNVSGLPGMTTLVDTTAPSAGAAFYRIGTDSTNGSSALWLQTPRFVPSSLAVTWTSVTNRSYFLQRSSNLRAQPAFSTLQTNIVGQSGTTTFSDTNAIGAGPWFYRVGVQN